jgi:hypothetical protein
LLEMLNSLKTPMGKNAGLSGNECGNAAKYVGPPSICVSVTPAGSVPPPPPPPPPPVPGVHEYKWTA